MYILVFNQKFHGLRATELAHDISKFLIQSTNSEFYGQIAIQVEYGTQKIPIPSRR